MENNGEFHELNEFFRFRIAGELLELVGLRPQNYRKIGAKKLYLCLVPADTWSRDMLKIHKLS
jgi:hypothetical protein